MLTRGIKNPTPGAKATAAKAKNAAKAPPPGSTKAIVALQPSTKVNVDETSASKGSAMWKGRVMVAVGAKPAPYALPAVLAASGWAPAPSFNQYHDAMEEYANSVDENTGKTNASMTHMKRCIALELAFRESVMVQQAGLIPSKLRENVRVYPNNPESEEVPALFLACAGPSPNLGQKKAVSKSAYYFFSRLKPVRETGCPDYQPASLMCLVRTFFGHMKETYDWNYNVQNDFNFQGGMVPALNDLFARRRKIHGPEYGTEKKETVLKDAKTVADCDLTVFDLDDPKDHTRATMTSFGLYLAYRGIKDHTYMERGNIERGTYTSGPFQGKDYWEVVGLIRKTNKLSVTNPVLRSPHPMRIPVDSDPGRIIGSFLEKLHPQQKRLYCKPATKNILAHYAACGAHKAVYNYKMPL